MVPGKNMGSYMGSNSPKNHPKMAYFSHNLGIKAISPSEHGVIAYRWIQNDERRSKMYMSALAGIENLDINAKMRLTNACVNAFSPTSRIRGSLE